MNLTKILFSSFIVNFCHKVALALLHETSLFVCRLPSYQDELHFSYDFQFRINFLSYRGEPEQAWDLLAMLNFLHFPSSTTIIIDDKTQVSRLFSIELETLQRKKSDMGRSWHEMPILPRLSSHISSSRRPAKAFLLWEKYVDVHIIKLVFLSCCLFPSRCCVFSLLCSLFLSFLRPPSSGIVQFSYYFHFHSLPLQPNSLTLSRFSVDFCRFSQFRPFARANSPDIACLHSTTHKIIKWSNLRPSRMKSISLHDDAKAAARVNG